MKKKSRNSIALIYTTLSFFSLTLIFIGLCNVAYVGFFIKSNATQYPSEIIYSHILVFTGSIVLAILFEFKKLNQFNSFYKAAKIAKQKKGRLSALFFVLFSIVALTIFPIFMEGKLQIEQHLSMRQLIIKTKAFYIVFNLLSFFVLSIVAFEFFVSILSSIKDNLNGRNK